MANIENFVFILIGAFTYGAMKMLENLTASSLPLSPSAFSICRRDSIAFPDAFPFLYVRIEQ